MEANSDKKLLVVDSMALLFRGFFATSVSGPIMQTSAGLYTNGVYQFTKYMMDAIKKVQPTHVACAFDMGKTTFRNELYTDYKANRSEPPQELLPQFDLLRELVEAFDIPVVGVKGYEADDVMGTMSSIASNDGYEVFLLTGDGDALQLINEQTTVVLMKKGFGNYEWVNHVTLPELKGIDHPSQIIELKALMGDSSDNIPGCPGIGPKIATQLLQAYGTIEGVFENIDDIKGKRKERLLENKELIYLSRQLATIRRDVPLTCTLDDCVMTFNRDKIVSKFEELEFRTLAKLIS